MLEKSVERMLRDGIEARVPKARCLKFVTPGFTGVPDRIILLPGAETVFVELKRPRQVERQRQLFVQAGLRKLGFKVFSAVDSSEKVQEVIDYCGRCEGGGGA